MDTLLLVLTITGIALQVLLLLSALFEPPLPYRIGEPPGPALDSDGFARILGTLVHELRRRGGGLGCAAICSGGGQGDAVVVEVNGG